MGKHIMPFVLLHYGYLIQISKKAFPLSNESLNLCSRTGGTYKGRYLIVVLIHTCCYSCGVVCIFSLLNSLFRPTTRRRTTRRRRSGIIFAIPHVARELKVTTDHQEACHTIVNKGHGPEENLHDFCFLAPR
jgi:hypothetical protein